MHTLTRFTISKQHIKLLIRKLFNQASKKFTDSQLHITPVKTLSLALPINRNTHALKIALSTNDILHLSKFIAFDFNGLPISNSEIASLECSSQIASKPHLSPDNFINDDLKKFFSTKNEKQPWIEIKFKNHIKIGYIIIINRQDGLWERASTLTIKLNGQNTPVLDLTKEQDIEKIYLYNCKQLVELIRAKQKKECYSSSQLEQQLKRLTKSKNVITDFSRLIHLIAEDEELYQEIISQPDIAIKLAQLIVASNKIDHPEYWKLVLNILISLKTNASLIDAKLFTKTLESRCKSLTQNEIDKEANRAAQRYLKHSLIRGPHAYSRPLNDFPKESLFKTLNDIDLACSKINLPVCLAYGTLLGLYRDKKFIQHDDDMDVLAISPSYDQLTQSVKELQTQLTKLGLTANQSRCNDIITTPFLSVRSKEHPVHTDVFFGWIEGKWLCLPMANVSISRIPLDVVMPLSKPFDEGLKINSPNSIEAFLEYRYGNTWKTPDPNFRQSERINNKAPTSSSVHKLTGELPKNIFYKSPIPWLASPLPLGSETKLCGLKVSIPKRETLHFSGIEVLTENKWKQIDQSHTVKVSFSSEKKQHPADNIFTKSTSYFSTEDEDTPFIELHFREPISARAIRLINRRTGFWGRLNDCKIEAIEENSKLWISIVTPSKPYNSHLHLRFLIDNTLQELSKIDHSADLSLKTLITTISKSTSINAIKKCTQTFFNKKINNKKELITTLKDSEHYQALLSLCFAIDMKNNKDLLLFTMCHLLARKLTNDAYFLIKHNYKDLTKEATKQINQLAETIGACTTGHPYIMAAHTFSRPLNSYPKKDLLQGIEKVQTLCMKKGIKSIIAYGTLL